MLAEYHGGTVTVVSQGLAEEVLSAHAGFGSRMPKHIQGAGITGREGWGMVRMNGSG